MVLSEEQKNTLINKYKLKFTVTEIAKSMNVNKNTVQLWIKRYKQNKTLQRKVGSGVKIIDVNAVEHK